MKLAPQRSQYEVKLATWRVCFGIYCAALCLPPIQVTAFHVKEKLIKSSHVHNSIISNIIVKAAPRVRSINSCYSAQIRMYCFKVETKARWPFSCTSDMHSLFNMFSSCIFQCFRFFRSVSSERFESVMCRELHKSNWTTYGNQLWYANTFKQEYMAQIEIDTYVLWNNEKYSDEYLLFYHWKFIYLFRVFGTGLNPNYINRYTLKRKKQREG